VASVMFGCLRLIVVARTDAPFREMHGVGAG
jgi:hypothetical protein